MPGPPPKRSGQRRRRNKGPRVDHAPAGEVRIHPADMHWHPTARRWYEALQVSGQRVFFEQTDWEQAHYVAGLMSKSLEQEVPGAALVAQVLAGMSSLLSSEADRRRMRIELERSGVEDADEEAAVSALDAYRKRLSG